jgi:hypothetical protein
VRSHKWAEIKATLRPETRAGIEAGARTLAEELHLAQLRKAKGLYPGSDGGIAGRQSGGGFEN